MRLSSVSILLIVFGYIFSVTKNLLLDFLKAVYGLQGQKQSIAGCLQLQNLMILLSRKGLS